jgi:hypothetical protein
MLEAIARNWTALAIVTCLTIAFPAAAAEGGDVRDESGDGGPVSDAAMAPPDEDDPHGSGCSCFWTDDTATAHSALGLPLMGLFLVRRFARRRH